MLDKAEKPVLVQLIYQRPHAGLYHTVHFDRKATVVASNIVVIIIYCFSVLNG